MKCPQEKCWTDERPTKKYWTHETPTKKIVDQQISTRKNFGPRKYPPESFGPMKARWHGGTRPMRPTMARDSRNLAHSTDTGNQPEAS